MVYTPEQVQKLAQCWQKWEARNDDLTTAMATHAYRLERSRVMATHGLLRRLRTMLHCVRRIYEAVPPDHPEPARMAIHDAEAYLQAFIINVYGALDNLARIWCAEADLQHRGKQLPNNYIGLGPAHELVRQSLSEHFQVLLAKANTWFGYLENYRHALAHRVPLYIPPRTLDEAAQKEWHRLEGELMVASEEHRHEDHFRLSVEQKKVGVFESLMQHSYGDQDTDGTPVPFHGQVLCDLATVVEIGEQMVAELRALNTRA